MAFQFKSRFKSQYKDQIQSQSEIQEIGQQQKSQTMIEEIGHARRAHAFGFGAMFCMALLVFGARTAFAAGGIDSKGFVGGLFGLHIPDADDTSARPAFGITGGAKLGTEFAIAGYYMSSSKEEENDLGITGDFNYTMYGVEGSYHFEGEAAGVYVGGRLGMTDVKVGTIINGAKISFAPTHLGIVGGYNHWLAENMSLGGEVAYYSVGESDKTYLASKRTLEGFNILSFMASAKLWF